MAILAVALAVPASTASASVPAGAGSTRAASPVSVGPISDVSKSCSGQNAEVSQAVDPAAPGYAYEAWVGCQGIGFARSTNDGASFASPVTLPDSRAAPWDPAVAVAPNGTVYVAFMVSQGGQDYPVVDASFDHGLTFPQATGLVPPDPKNWGDSPNLAVGPDGTIYITWDYGPSSASVVLLCSPVGSCSYSKGDLNIVVQKSTDAAKTFGAMVQVTPGYPWSGADIAPVVVGPSGRVNVLYQDYPTNHTTHVLSPASIYFTSSDDGGATWSAPVAVGAGAGTMSTAEWWNEPSLGIDIGGNLYAAWDTQGRAGTGAASDTGWLSYSHDGGVSWSAPTQAPADQSNVPHIMEVVGGLSGTASVAWLSDSDPLGYALYLRPFSIGNGWLATPRRISKAFGNRTVWPGDTFGLSAIDPSHIMTSWGSTATPGAAQSAIWGAEVQLSAQARTNSWRDRHGRQRTP